MKGFSPRRWIEPQPVQPSTELIDLVSGSRLAADMLVRRGITDPNFARGYLFPEQYKPSPPTDFPGMDAAVDRILLAIQKDESVCIWGDFDVDGQTSTTILVSTLRMLGGRVSHHIPIRDTESHGVHLQSLQQLARSGVQLLVTCDTGIAAVEEVKWAKANGVDVIITDHHELPDELPPADTVINPRLLPPQHPLSTLPGCGVAFKLAEELLDRSGKGELVDSLLDLTALGIVADVAELRGDARYLLQRGLASLRTTRRVGLIKLYEKAGVTADSLNEETIGFALSPRLNALGRLADANPIVDFMTTASNTEAVIFVDRLEKLNMERRNLCDQVYQGARGQIESNPALLTASALVLSHPEWHPGVIGIVAARLMEIYDRPVILFNAPMDGIARGSARSVPGINITQAIGQVSGMLKSFGGHPMAAGLSLPTDRIPEFRQALSYAIDDQIGGIQPESVLTLDATLPLDRVALITVQEIEQLAPFGNGNPAPVFMSPNHRVVDVLPVGVNKEHQIVKVENEAGSIFKILRWQGSDLPLPEGAFDLAYTPRASTFQGTKTLQLEWVDSRPAQVAGAQFQRRSRMEVVDRRSEDRAPILAEYSASPDVMVWNVGTVELHPADILVIAFSPPGADEIKSARALVKPKKIVLIKAAPAVDDPVKLLQNIMQMIARLMNSSAPATLEDMAFALGQRMGVVRLALDYLVASGRLDYSLDTAGILHVQRTNRPPGREAALAEKRLRESLAETSAFRRHFASASLADLIHDHF